MTGFEWLVTVLTIIEVIFMIVVAWKWWQARQFDTEHMEMSHDYQYQPQSDMTPEEAVILGRAFNLYGEFISTPHLNSMASWAQKNHGFKLKRHYKKIK